MTIDITDYCYVNGCSVVGLMVDETVSVRELFYGTILPSGADATLGLATYVLRLPGGLRGADEREAGGAGPL